MKKEIAEIHDVFPGIQSVQFSELKIKTYHKIVNNNGIE